LVRASFDESNIEDPGELASSLSDMLAAAGLYCAKQVVELRKPVQPARAFHMFHEHVWLGSAILVGSIAGFLL